LSVRGSKPVGAGRGHEPIVIGGSYEPIVIGDGHEPPVIAWFVKKNYNFSYDTGLR
jgi:hypothetical protein